MPGGHAHVTSLKLDPLFLKKVGNCIIGLFATNLEVHFLIRMQVLSIAWQ